MRVLMLGWELPPHNSGGLGIACFHLCKALSEFGADIEFVIPYSANHNVDFMRVVPADAHDKRLRLPSNPYTAIYGSDEASERIWQDVYVQQYAYEQAVAKLVKKKRFDIIHSHDWLTFRAALRAKEYSGKPLILHVHSIESDRAGESGKGNPMVREIEATTMMMADKIIAVSHHTKRAIVREYGIPENMIGVVHNSISSDAIEPLDTDNAYRYLSQMKAQGYKVVTNIGRLTIQKGLPNLLRAAKEVVVREPKTLFLIVGSGDQYYELIEQAAELGIAENVIFTGFQRGKKWRDAYAIADLFVMPSISEPFGLTPLEAIAYGTPSLISKQSGVAEVLRHCLKVDFWDVDEMANQIVAAVRNQPLLDELRDNAHRQFRSMSWHKPASQFMQLYNHHIAGAKV